MVCVIEGICPQHIPLAVSLDGIPLIILRIVHHQDLFVPSRPFVVPRDGIGQSHIAIPCCPQIVVTFVVSISVVDSMQNALSNLALMVVNDGKLEIVIAICRNHNIFHFELWIVDGANHVDGQKASIVRHVQVMRFQYLVKIYEVGRYDFNLSGANLIFEVQDEQTSCDLRNVQPVLVIHMIIDQMGVTNESLVVFPAMSIHKVIAVDIVKFLQLFCGQGIHLDSIQIDTSASVFDPTAWIDIGHSHNLVNEF